MIDDRGAGGRAWSFRDGEDTAETTGRYVVTFRDDEEKALPGLRAIAGADLVRSEDFEDSQIDMAQVDEAGGLFLPELGVAVVNADRSGVASLMASDEGRGTVLAVEPERVHRVLDNGDYVRGYADGALDLGARLKGDRTERAVARPAPAAGVAFDDTADWTWGLQATKAVASSRSGAGIRVAVLDTGFFLGHPDFVGRPIVARSFIPNETAEDGHGHGTHCAGTACGPKQPTGVPRYGVAYDADLLVGKVLSNAGSGTDAGILAGITWAMRQKADIISMSLGADVKTVSQAYTQVGRRALNRGTLIIAAAGNNADRDSGNPGFVGIPANAPTIIAVGALDKNLNIAWFSAGTNPVRGGQVDLAGPGVAVLSAWTAPLNHRSINGTSMATPHAAGIAALWAQETGLRGRDLWATLAAESTRLPLPSVDVGGGLVTAPQ